jgi:hypothetical integral membrane protein (TIGR02206 family)
MFCFTKQAFITNASPRLSIRKEQLHSPASSTFKIFSAAHFSALAVIILLCIAVWIIFRPEPDQPRVRTIARWLAGILAAIELSWYILLASKGQFTIHETLPLHVCDLSIWAVIATLLVRNQLLFEWSWFFGIGGGLQALLTPELRETFPSLPALKFFTSHGGILIGVSLLSAGLGMRPTWKSVGRMIIAGNIYIFVVGILDYLMKANYGYLCHKPASASLLDYLGRWPWYLASMEAIAIMMMLLLYFPWYIADLIAKKRSLGAHSAT